MYILLQYHFQTKLGNPYIKGSSHSKVDNTIHQINLITIQQMGHLLSLRFILWIVTFSLT